MESDNSSTSTQLSSMKVKLVRFRTISKAEESESVDIKASMEVPAFMRSFARSTWSPNCIANPTIFESSEEDIKDDISSSSSTASMESETDSLSLLLPDCPLREEQEVVLIEAPPPQSRDSPPPLRRCHSSEAIMETSTPKRPTSPTLTPSPPPIVLESEGSHPLLMEERPEQHNPPTKKKGHRRLASAPPQQSLAPPNLKALKAHLKELKHRYGSTHPLVAATYNLIGNFCFRQREYDKALEAYKQAVQCNSGEHLADAYSNMGTVYWSTGQLNLAIDFLKKALRVHEYNEVKVGKKLSESLPVASIRYQLGLVYTLQRSFDQAMDCLIQARKIRERVHGRAHLDVARTMDATGKVYLLQGDYQPALVTHEEAFRIKEGLNGNPERSKAMCESLLNISAVHRARNDLEAATFTYRAIVEIQKQALRDLKTRSAILEVAGSLNTLGELYIACKQNGKAQDAYYEADLFYDAAGVAVEDRPPKARIASEQDSKFCFANCFDISCLDAADILYDASGLK